LTTPEPLLAHFFDTVSSTFTHVVACPLTGRAAVIDPVLDFDSKSACTSSESAERVLGYLADEKLTLEWILETHVHADHLSAGDFLRTRTGGRLAIGAEVRAIQRVFVDLFGLRGRVAADGSQFDRLWRDGERFALGSLDVRVLETPGHTCDGVTYLVGRHAFVGDTIFRASYGTARCDFPGGDAETLFTSIRRLYALPDDSFLHFCHDYPTVGHEPVETQTVAEERTRNVHLSMNTTREQFVSLRRSRDVSLQLPALLIPAVQVNIAAGRLPAPDSDGRCYLRMPLNTLSRSFLSVTSTPPPAAARG
jgi:glyoxylase-like metal-dependent hydrolase (beta-lactamase superfamily II)